MISSTRTRITQGSRTQLCNTWIQNQSRRCSNVGTGRGIGMTGTVANFSNTSSSPSALISKSIRRDPISSRFYSTHSNPRFNLNSKPHSPSFSRYSTGTSTPHYLLITLSTLTLTSLLIYQQSHIQNEELTSISHNQPGQDEFGDVNPSILTNDPNKPTSNSASSMSMGQNAILTQQELMRERTRLLGVCAWGSNRYNVAAPDQPQLNVIKTPRWIPYFTGVALRDLILEEKHGVAVDSNGDVLQWGLGFFDPSCRGTTSNNQGEIDPLLDPEVAAASFLSFSDQTSSKNQGKKRSDRKPITNKEPLPYSSESDLNKKALAPVKTLVGKNIVKLHANDNKVFALSKDGDLYVFSARIDQQEKTKPGDWSKNPLKLFGLFNGKQIDHERISSFLVKEDHSRKEGLTRGEKISDIVGGTNHLLALTNKGRALSLPIDERGNTFGQLGSRRTLLNGPGGSKGNRNLVELDLEPRMLSSLNDTDKFNDPTKMLPEWALPPPEVMAALTAKAEAAQLASGGKVTKSSSSSSSSLTTPPSNPTETSTPSIQRPVTEPPSSIRFCTSLREIPSLRGVKLSQIASGREHSAALTPDGRVVAFGRNTHGQCGLGSQVTLECVPTPSEINLSRSFPATSSEIKCTRIFLGADNSYFVTSRREGPLKFDSDEFSNKSKAALMLASGTKIDVLACGKGQWGGLGNAMWSQINGNPTKVKTVSGLMEFSESELTSHPVPIHDISIGRPGNVALTLDTVEKESHHAFGRDVMVFGFNAAFNLGNGKRSNLAVPQHLPPLPRQVQTTVDQQKAIANSNLENPSVEIPLPTDEKKSKQLREADINSGVLTHMPHKRLQLASITQSTSLVPKFYSNNQLNSEKNGSEKKKVDVEERILSGASSMAVWFKANA